MGCHAQVAQWAAVEQALDFVGFAKAIAEQQVAAIGKGPARIDLVRIAIGPPARQRVQQPAHARVAVGMAAEDGVAQRQQLRGAVHAGCIQAEHATIVGVAHGRHIATDIAYRAQKAQRALQAAPVRPRKRSQAVAAGLGQQAGHEQKFTDEQVVAKGLLAVDTIARELRLGFHFQLVLRQRLPIARLFPARPGDGAHVQAGQFADQVVIGRRMARQMARDRTAMGVDAAEPVGAQALPGVALEQRAAVATDQLPDQTPVDQPDAQLARTGPVGAGQRRTLLEPAAQVLLERIHPARIARERPGLCQPHEVQVAIQFPDMLDVAHQLAVVDGEVAPVHGRRGHAGVGIAVPCGWHAHVEAAIGKQHDVPCTDAFGVQQQRIDLALIELGRTAHAQVQGRHGRWRRARQRQLRAARHAPPQPDRSGLLDPVSHLGHRHAAQAVDQPHHVCSVHCASFMQNSASSTDCHPPPSVRGSQRTSGVGAMNAAPSRSSTW